ncbi:MAG: 16S rRNA (guanine(966)-N(2))-methyltransferase RsmD [Xanthomonadales bacterium]|nr:16S rRNA (guanine(966)-N(2))-methyltransferase RsmD [Xanthomonadales bacterium]
MGQIRITGGLHRSRKIKVEDQPGLRPTADRVRETLFSWLGQNLSDKSVLDLYAGSGILAIEAASRGATEITCVENNRQTRVQLQKNIDLLGLSQIKVIQQNARDFIKASQVAYDILFLDPPFDSDEMNAINDIITPLVKAGGLVYREYATSQEIVPLSDDHWERIKYKKAGQVIFELWHKTA